MSFIVFLLLTVKLTVKKDRGQELEWGGGGWQGILRDQHGGGSKRAIKNPDRERGHPKRTH